MCHFFTRYPFTGSSRSLTWPPLLTVAVLPVIADMLDNQMGMGVGSIPDFIESHKVGEIRVVAVLGDKRQASLPEVRDRLTAMGPDRGLHAAGAACSP